MKIFKVEVGVLLPEDDEEFNSYNQVYDKSHGFFDEDVSFFTFESLALAYAANYVRHGVPETYGIVVELDANLDKEQIKEIEEHNTLGDWVDGLGPEQFTVDNVISTIHLHDGVLYIDQLFDFPRKKSYINE